MEYNENHNNNPKAPWAPAAIEKPPDSYQLHEHNADQTKLQQPTTER
jgi:hypothetical protein